MGRTLNGTIAAQSHSSVDPFANNLGYKGYNKWCSTGITLAADEYPTHVQISGYGTTEYGGGWFIPDDGTSSGSAYVELYGIGNQNRIPLFPVSVTSGRWANRSYQPGTQDFDIDGSSLMGQQIGIMLKGETGYNAEYSLLLNRTLNITVTTEYDRYSVTVNQTTGGTVTPSAAAVTPGGTCTLDVFPSPGYRLSGYNVSPAGVTISNNSFVMPHEAVTIIPVWEQTGYTIIKAVNPAGAGTVTAPNTAVFNSSVSVSQSAADGYTFTGWTLSTGGTVTNNAFVMPARDVTLTANYRALCSASMNTKICTGGQTVTLAVSRANNKDVLKYKLSFGTNMETSVTTIPAGTNSVTISIPASWASQIPNAQTKTGGTITIYSYRDSEQDSPLLGTTTITGLTYQVPSDAAPVFSSHAVHPGSSYSGYDAHFVTGLTNELYVQNHAWAAVSISATAAYGASIASIAIELPEYQGATGYSTTITNAAIASWASGLLTMALVTTINVLVTDSRGLTASWTTTISVTPYTPPVITGLDLWRVDTLGNPSDIGTHAQYAFTYTWTDIGNNEIHNTMLSQSVTEQDLLPAGWVLDDSSPQVFPINQYFDITLTIYDALETTSLTYRLDSAKAAMNFSPSGESVAFGHIIKDSVQDTNQYTGTFEIDEGMEVHLGWNNAAGYLTLKEYIQGIINGTIT